MIAAGLNEGVWPEAPTPDPWLNRRMRHQAGLLLPERRIGLSAHDFQQAVTAPEVVLTRAIRDAEAATVSSRWLNRLTNLLGGISDQSREAMAAMRARGDAWLGLATTLDQPKTPDPPARRPAPRPPVDHRPKRLSITRVQTLIRDPYAIYAGEILRLTPLDPLRPEPDAPMRGTILHRVLERFVREVPLTDRATDLARLMVIADEVLAAGAPWPTARRIWRAKLARVAGWFLDGEDARRATDAPLMLEAKGEMAFDRLDLALRGKLDRVDRRPDGTVAIYDYKTGAVPSKDQVMHFDRQLFLAAMMVEAGAVEGVPTTPVSTVAHIGLGAVPKLGRYDLGPGDVADTRTGFEKLIGAYRVPDQGYLARRAVYLRSARTEYDGLSRYGEWDETDTAEGVEVGA